jgi:hypothetical protein
MTGADLLTHLQFLGRHFLDERRVGWGFSTYRIGLTGDVALLAYLGPERSRMTLQEAVQLLIYILTQRSTMDQELEILNDYSSDVTESGDFIFQRLRGGPATGQAH